MVRAISYYEWYDSCLRTHRLLTTTLTGGVLALVGDAFTQTATQPSYDLTRGVSFAIFGATVTGPVNFWWLSRLDAIVTKLAPAGGALAIGTKVVVQTFFFQPMVYVPLFFTFSACFRGWSMSTAWSRVEAEYSNTVRSIWGFWTPICVFTFAVLPVRHQAVFFSAVSLGWNAILSFLSNRPASCPSCTERHLPPMGIVDNDGLPPIKNPALSNQRIIGFILGPGLM